MLLVENNHLQGQQEEQAKAGGEETNITNATSGEQPAQAKEEQKQAEGEEEQAQAGRRRRNKYRCN